MIPKYESGNIYAVYEDKTMMSLSITDTEDEYFEEYLEGIKEIFNNNTQESQVDMEYLYLGTDDKGNSIQVLTYEEDKGIVLWPNQDSVDIKIDWPESNLVKIIPEYDSGEILNVAQSEEAVTILLEDEDENYFNDYVDNIKKDFDENNFETETDDWYQFSGENGNRKSIGISYDGNNVSVTISHY
jgi:hypothetical protein